jgi:hypothetical protein
MQLNTTEIAGSELKCADTNTETREKKFANPNLCKSKVQSRNRFVNARFVNVMLSCERIEGTGLRRAISKGRI